MSAALFAGAIIFTVLALICWSAIFADERATLVNFVATIVISMAAIYCLFGVFGMIQ